MNLKTKPLRAAVGRIHKLATGGNLPILSSFRIGGQNRLRITASNLDISAEVEVEAQGTLPDCCVSAQWLVAAANLPGEEITLERDKDWLSAECGGFTAKRMTLPASEWPEIKRDGKAIGLNCADLGAAIKRVKWCASDDPARYTLTGVHVQATARELVIEATDGRKLARIEKAAIAAECNFILPSAACDLACDFLAGDHAVLKVAENAIEIESDLGFVRAKLIEGNFPNCRQVINLTREPIGICDGAAVSDALETMLGFGSDPKHRPSAVFEFSASGIAIKSADEQRQSSRTIAGKFEPRQIKLDTAWARDCFACVGEGAKLSLVDDLSPLHLENGEMLVVIIGMRMP